MAKYGTRKYPNLKDGVVNRSDAKRLAEDVVDALWADIVSVFAQYSQTPPHRDEAVRQARILIQGMKASWYKREKERGWQGGWYYWRAAIPAWVCYRRKELYEKRTGKMWAQTQPACPPNLHGMNALERSAVE